MERQATEQKKFSVQTTKKGLLFMKSPTNLINTTTTPIEKWAKKLNRHVKEYRQHDSICIKFKNMKNELYSLGISKLDGNMIEEKRNDYRKHQHGGYIQKKRGGYDRKRQKGSFWGTHHGPVLDSAVILQLLLFSTLVFHVLSAYIHATFHN